MPTFVTRANGETQAKIRLAGHAPQSQTFKTKTAARVWAYEEERRLRSLQSGTVKCTLGEAIQKYIDEVCPDQLSGAGTATRLKGFKHRLPSTRLMTDITPLDISTFRDARMKECGPGTVIRELGILRSLFECARRDWGMVSINPVADVRKPPTPPSRKRLMTDLERDQIVQALGYTGKVEDGRHQTAIALLLALETAMRSSEILTLTWANVFLDKRFLTLPKTKNGDQRDVPLSTAAVELLRKMVGVHNEKVFTVTPARRDEAFREARNACGIKDLHFHDARATALTRLAGKLDVLELARMVGHRDPRSLMIYFRTTASTIALKLD